MTQDVEDLLRDGIDRITENARVPDGLLARARQHHRRQRLTVQAAAAGGVAVAAGVAVVVTTSVTGGAGYPGGALQAHTTAYVTSHAARALGAVSGRAIQEIHVITRGGSFSLITREPSRQAEHATTGTTLPAGALGRSLAVSEMNIWSYRGQYRQQGFSAAGRVVFDASSDTTTSSRGLQTVRGYGVDYLDRTWWRRIEPSYHVGATPPLSCQTVALASPLGGGDANWSGQIREGLSCGLYQVAGRQRVDGIDAIKLVLAKPTPGLTVLRQALWVDRSSYLPVRVSWTWPDGQRQGSLVGDIRWLPPNAANRARLKSVVPAGFRQVAPGGLPQPAFGFSATAPR
jgi:hypothetical protein